MANSAVTTLFGQLAQATAERQREKQMLEQQRQFDMQHLMEQARLNQQGSQFDRSFDKSSEQFDKTFRLQEGLQDFNKSTKMIDLVGSGAVTPIQEAPIPGGIGIMPSMGDPGVVNLSGQPFRISDQFALSQKRKMEERESELKLAQEEQTRQRRLLADAGFSPIEAAAISLNPGAGVQFAAGNRNPQRRLADKIMASNDPDEIKSAFDLMLQFENASQPASRTAQENAHAQYYLNQLSEARAASGTKALINKGSQLAPVIIANIKANLNTPEGLKEAYTFINNAQWDAETKQAATAWLASESNLNSQSINPAMAMLAGILGGGSQMPVPQAQTPAQPQLDPKAVELIRQMLEASKQPQATPRTPGRTQQLQDRMFPK